MVDQNSSSASITTYSSIPLSFTTKRKSPRFNGHSNSSNSSMSGRSSRNIILLGVAKNLDTHDGPKHLFPKRRYNHTTTNTDSQSSTNTNNSNHHNYDDPNTAAANFPFQPFKTFMQKVRNDLILHFPFLTNRGRDQGDRLKEECQHRSEQEPTVQPQGQGFWERRKGSDQRQGQGQSQAHSESANHLRSRWIANDHHQTESTSSEAQGDEKIPVFRKKNKLLADTDIYLLRTSKYKELDLHVVKSMSLDVNRRALISGAVSHDDMNPRFLLSFYQTVPLFSQSDEDNKRNSEKGNNRISSIKHPEDQNRDKSSDERGKSHLAHTKFNRSRFFMELQGHATTTCRFWVMASIEKSWPLFKYIELKLRAQTSGWKKELVRVGLQGYLPLPWESSQQKFPCVANHIDSCQCLSLSPLMKKGLKWAWGIDSHGRKILAFRKGFITIALDLQGHAVFKFYFTRSLPDNFL